MMSDDRIPGTAVILCVPLVVCVGCRESPDPPEGAQEQVLDFDTATVRLVTVRDTVALALELAVRPDQHRVGLMERRHLPERASMLFVYDATQPPEAGFWMYRTRLPLDIAFLDSLGVIRSIRSMLPCPATLPAGCPTYTPDTPYRYALEVNAGALERWGAVAGTRLLVDELPARQRDTTRAPRTR